MNEYQKMVRDLSEMREGVWYRIYRKDDVRTGWRYVEFEEALQVNEARGVKYVPIVSGIDSDKFEVVAWNYSGLVRKSGDTFDLGEMDESGVYEYRRKRRDALENGVTKICGICGGFGLVKGGDNDE